MKNVQLQHAVSPFYCDSLAYPKSLLFPMVVHRFGHVVWCDKTSVLKNGLCRVIYYTTVNMPMMRQKNDEN